MSDNSNNGELIQNNICVLNDEPTQNNINGELTQDNINDVTNIIATNKYVYSDQILYDYIDNTIFDQNKNDKICRLCKCVHNFKKIKHNTGIWFYDLGMYYYDLLENFKNSCNSELHNNTMILGKNKLLNYIKLINNIYDKSEVSLIITKNEFWNENTLFSNLINNKINDDNIIVNKTFASIPNFWNMIDNNEIFQILCEKITKENFDDDYYYNENICNDIFINQQIIKQLILINFSVNNQMIYFNYLLHFLLNNGLIIDENILHTNLICILIVLTNTNLCHLNIKLCIPIKFDDKQKIFINTNKKISINITDGFTQIS